MAGYGTVGAYAKLLKEKTVLKLLQATFAEEKATDEAAQPSWRRAQSTSKRRDAVCLANQAKHRFFQTRIYLPYETILIRRRHFSRSRIDRPGAGRKKTDPNSTPGGNQSAVTTDTGRPISDDRNSTTVGPYGPTLLQDSYLIEKLARFDRERIPERVVHARGVGVHGEFEVTSDVTPWTKADFLSTVGMKTPVFARFSTVILPKGSADTARDVRGFAVKFYTKQGNYDIPVFFIRDAIRFPDIVHAAEAVTGHECSRESNRFFQKASSERPRETTHMMTFLFSDQGTPASYREMDGFGVNSFKWVNARNEVFYVRYRWKSAQGVRNLTDDQAKMVGGKEPAFCTKDMYDAVTSGKFPSWELEVQIVPATKLRPKCLTSSRWTRPRFGRKSGPLLSNRSAR